MSRTGSRTRLGFHALANIFPLLTGEEFEALVEDIRANGLREPIRLYEGKILDGRNRFKACQKAKVKPRFTDYSGEPLALVLSANLHRRHLTESQRAALAVQTLPHLEAEAKKRQGTRTDKHSGKIAGKSRGDSRSYAAKMFCVSPRYVQDAKKIQSQAPELCEKMRDGIITIPEAKILANLGQEQRSEILDRRAKNPKVNVRLEYQDLHKRDILSKAVGLQTVKGKYQILLADCPWDMPPSGTYRGIQNHYPTMTLGQLKALPVKKIAADASVLFLWTINSRLEDALELMREWGFAYQTNIVWTKDPQWGLGHWVRTKHELLLIGKRGNMPTPLNIPASVIHTTQHNRARRHSEKPKEAYELIESMYPGVNMRRLELFSRAARTGWAVWGAESESQKSESEAA